MSGYGDSKREHGQWMTDGDPFYLPVVTGELSRIIRGLSGDDGRRVVACEPYAGALSLPRYVLGDVDGAGLLDWFAFDIEPNPEPVMSGVRVREADTLGSIPLPVGDDGSPVDAVNDYGYAYDLIVTNPPYLARNSATRRGIVFPGTTRRDDLYQVALDTCLSSAAYTVAIIPESFITSKYPKDRCIMCVSLRHGLFTDTDCPVCLAFFGPVPTGAGMRIITNSGESLGTLDSLLRLDRELLGDGDSAGFLRCNDPNGDVGLHATDGSTRSIRFTRASEDDIPASSVKVSSRSLSRISRTDGKPITDDQIERANRLLNQWRDDTGEILMTAFKGPRRDGGYRRRLSFRDATRILLKAIIDSTGSCHAPGRYTVDAKAPTLPW